jgi:hypothetical protein
MSYILVEDGVGHADVKVDWCEAELEKQEDVYCHREKGHGGSHEAYVGWPPCDSCGGLDMHEDDCPLKEQTTAGSVTVQWEATPSSSVGEGDE